MRLRKVNSRIGLVAVMLAAGLLGAAGMQAQDMNGNDSSGQSAPPTLQQGEQQRQNPPQNGRGPTIDPAEETAYKAFNSTLDPDAKIKAGEDFDQKFPESRYAASVDATMVTLYYDKQDWTHFYPEADKALAKDPDNVPVLTLVGWVIPRVYKADDPNEPAKLDQSEKDEKHALEVIAAMPKPTQLTDDQFNQAKATAAAEAHSGLGLTYFRRSDFEDSATELQTATTESPNVDPTDLYILGIDLQKLNRNSDAAAAFTKCSQMASPLQQQCKSSADATTKTGSAK